jgi:lipopolysaccharide export system permease protein
MLQQYVRYMSRGLLAALALLAFSLTALVWLTQALRFIEYIVNRGVSTLTFLHLTALMVPALLFVVLPMALFVAVIFTYYRMQNDSELVVLKSAGLSRLQLTRPVLVVGLGITLLSFFLSLYVLPVSYRHFKEMQSFLKDNYASLLLQEGVFNTPMDGLTVFVRERDKSGNLFGILVHDNRDTTQPITMMAQRGKLLQTETGPGFLLIQGNRQELQDGRLSFLKFDRYTIDLSFYAQEVHNRERKPEEFFLPALFALAKQYPDRRGELLAEAHRRIVWPLFNIAMALFAAGMMLSGSFNRRGQWKRITATAISGIILVALAMTLQTIVTNNPALVPLLYANLVAVMMAAFWLLSRSLHRAIPLSPPAELVEAG